MSFDLLSVLVLGSFIIVAGLLIRLLNRQNRIETRNGRVDQPKTSRAGHQ